MLIETDGPGGAESMFLALARGLRERGLDVRPAVLAGGMGWLSERLHREGFQVFQPTLHHPIDSGLVRGLLRWIRSESIALLHGHEFTMSFYAGVAGMLSGTPFVMTMHGGTGYAKVMRRRLALASVARSARAIVGVSDGTAALLSDALWIDRSDITVVPNGLDACSGSRTEGRLTLGVDSEERLILSVGNLYPVKGHDYLIRAAAALRERTDLPRWRVAIAGRGGEEQRLRALIQEFQLEQHVHLLGLRDDVPNLMAAADLVVMSSLSEGLPMAVLEAMLASKPLVCTRVGGIPDLIQHHQSGMLVEPMDSDGLARAIAEMLMAPEVAAEMGRRACAAAVERYSARAMVNAYQSLYAL
jgi:glycosyltransferase involved in cell wall biosynthesis